MLAPTRSTRWYLVQKLASDALINEQPKITEDWRVTVDAGGRYKMLGTRMASYNLTEKALRRRDKLFQHGRALYRDCAERPHIYDTIAGDMNADPNPLHPGGLTRVRALYNVHFSDTTTRPVGAPQYVVAPATPLRKVQPKLYFLLHYCDMVYGGVDAITAASAALGVPITPMTALHFMPGSHSIWCSAEDVSPHDMETGVRGVENVNISGITHETPDITGDVEASVVLRGVKGWTGGIDAELAFPNYINWDTSGLDGRAGVWSHRHSIDIGKALLSADYDEAFRLVMRQVAMVNYGMCVAVRDLEDSTRNRVSARFYNQIPPKYNWVKLILDTMANSPTPRGWSAVGFSKVKHAVTARFTQAAAASIWNSLARQRLEENPNGSRPGDLIMLPSGEVARCTVENEHGIENVIIPTLGRDSTVKNFPHLKTTLAQHGVEFSEFTPEHLPPSTPRHIVGMARDVSIEKHTGGLTEYVQTHNGNTLRSKRSWLNLKGATSRLFGENWTCIPCGKKSPASATRCWSCGEHVHKVCGVPEKQSTSHTRTMRISFKIPATSSPASMLSEMFSLHHLVVPREDLYLQTLMSAFKGTYYKPSKKLRKTVKRRQKAKAAPRLPTHLETYRPVYLEYTWPKNPLEDGKVEVVKEG